MMIPLKIFKFINFKYHHFLILLLINNKINNNLYFKMVNFKNFKDMK